MAEKPPSMPQVSGGAPQESLPEVNSGASSGASAAAKRRGEALRANLHRRKDQARRRAGEGAPSAPTATPEKATPNKD